MDQQRQRETIPAASVSGDDYHLAMGLAVQLPKNARRAHAVISRMRRFVEEMYGEESQPPGVVYCFADFKRDDEPED
jgi:hypothetical protein